MVMSGGIVTPPDRRPLDVQATPMVSAKTFEDIDILREKNKKRPRAVDQPTKND